jgi:hypothetical protein
VTTIYVSGTTNYGLVGDTRAYSLGTTSCNVGTTPVAWCDNNGGCGGGLEDEDHPVIAQNLYRLKNDRFEQVGMSWLKHGFVSTNSFDGACGSCVGPPLGGNQLGVGCTDTYGSGLNGTRPMGMRSEVNGQTGVFPFPRTVVGTSTAIDQRMQVKIADLDPALNAGARYWAEGHYVTADDALAGNAFNNASYREATISGPSFDIVLVGSTVREVPAITVWPVVDSTVELLNLDNTEATPVERFHVARKVTDLGGGNFHYEYAIHNHNSDRSAHYFVADLPAGTTIANVGFKDIDHHSGEPYATTDWVATVDAASGRITWAGEDFATNANANALRWGTMFNFWFDANTPADTVVHELGLFKPGTPDSLRFNFNGGPVNLFLDGFETGNTSAWAQVVP